VNDGVPHVGNKAAARSGIRRLILTFYLSRPLHTLDAEIKADCMTLIKNMMLHAEKYLSERAGVLT
jgi:hypothetical protein